MKIKISTAVFIFLLGCRFNNAAQPLALNALSEYLQFNSLSGSEKPAGQYMENLCRSMGLRTTVFSDSDSSYNFCASPFPFDDGKPSVILLNHIDVVPAADTGSWKYAPFSGRVSDDTIYGRGSLDMKGLAVMQVYALKKLKEMAGDAAPKYNLLALFVSGEESGGKNGAAKMIQPEMLKKLKPLVVFGEGGGGLTNVVPGKGKELCFFVSTAEKKSLWIKLEARVKTRGHGSAGGSKTAHKILLRAVNKIENTEQRIVVDKSTKRTFKALGKIMGGFKGFIVKHFDWWIIKPFRRKIVESNEALKVLVSNSYQLTRMDNPEGPVNQVAQSAAAYYDCRLLPDRTERPLLMKLLFRIIDPRIKITVLDESPDADPTKPDTHYDYLGKAIQDNFPGAHIIPVLFPATTDNSYFRSVGIPVYGVLPFQLSESMVESVHAQNEKLPVKAIEQGIQVYFNLLQNYLR